MNNCDIDCDNDGIPDLTEGISADNDLDGVLNYLDLDSDNDGIPDLYESGLTFLSTDTNKDGVLDSPNSLSTPLPKNSDQDGVPDYLDLDSDNDGLSDMKESGIAGISDINNEGVADGPDTDGDGIQNSVDTNSGAFGTPGRTQPRDEDNDGIPSYNDLRSKTIPLNDIYQAGFTNFDTDNDGIIDGSIDTNDQDGIADAIDHLLTTFGGLKAYPDMSVSLTIIPSIFIGMSTNGTMKIRVIEVNDVPSDGSLITVRVKTGFDWVFNITPGTNISGWTYQGIVGANHIFTSNMILQNSNSQFIVPFTFNSGGASGTYVFTVSIASGSGGELSLLGNADQETASYFPQ